MAILNLNNGDGMSISNPSEREKVATEKAKLEKEEIQLEKEEIKIGIELSPTSTANKPKLTNRSEHQEREVNQTDPEMILQESEVIQQNQDVNQQDPEMILQDPEVYQQDPEVGKQNRESDKIENEIETTQFSVIAKHLEPIDPKTDSTFAEDSKPDTEFAVATLKVDEIQEEPETSGDQSKPEVAVIVAKTEPKPESSKKYLKKRLVRVKREMVSIATKVKLLVKDILQTDSEDPGTSEMSETKPDKPETKPGMPEPVQNDQNVKVDVRPRYDPRFEEKSDQNLIEKMVLNLIDFMF